MAKDEHGERGGLWRLFLWGGAAVLLLTPYVAMQFTDDVVWTVSDFAIAGAAIGGVGLAFEVVARMSRNIAYRAGAATSLAAALLLFWVNGAVGFLGDEGNPANLMFAGVVMVAVLGAVLTGFRAGGMALAMFAAAAAQGLVGVIAFTAGLGSPGYAGVYEIVMGTSVFSSLWLVSGSLFRLAARQQAGATS
jgi:hypothetical protein